MSGKNKNNSTDNREETLQNDIPAVDEMFLHLLENSPIYVFFKDHNARTIKLSRNYEKMLGRPMRELLGKTMEQLFPLELAEKITADDLKVLENGQPLTVEEEFNGRFYLTAKFPIYRPGKNPFLAGYTIDITDRRLTDGKLNAANSRFEHLILFTPTIIYSCEASGDYRATSISDNVRSLLGYEPREFLEDSSFWIKNIHPDDREKILLGLPRIFRTGNHSHEYRFLHKDGSYRWMQDHLRLIEESGRKPAEIAGAMTDITERKCAEIALQEEHQRLEYILAITNTNINITDSEFNLRYVDPEWQKIYGNFSGRKCHEYFMGLDRPCSSCGIPGALKTGRTVIYEETMPRENNRIVEVHTIPFTDQNGEWLVAEFNVDITERKRTEEALAKSQKLEALSLLAGGIAHDFNNLLCGIFGCIEIAAMATQEKETAEHLSLALDTMGRARGLTQQLLTFSKGGAPIKKIDSLDPFITETVKFALSGSNVKCSFEINNDLWPCEFDRTQIGQVIDNLVINALQAMPKAGVLSVSAENIHLTDSGHALPGSGDFVKISIKDQGSGMPREILHKIFDPFFTTKSAGHGLGLATSYSIVQRHGGRIEVESEPGRGSTFSIILPALPGALLTDSGGNIVIHRGNGAILVMEDEEVIARTFAAMLGTMGYSTYNVSNEKEAMDFLKNDTGAGGKIAALIFDLTIPGGRGGKEALQEIRRMGFDIPAFVVSGYADDPVISNPGEYGFTASICKPFTFAELSLLLSRYIKKTE